jgi:hypothetical protein
VAQDLAVLLALLGEAERPVLRHADAVAEAAAGDDQAAGGVCGRCSCEQRENGECRGGTAHQE